MGRHDDSTAPRTAPEGDGETPDLRSRFEALVRDHARLMASAVRRVCGRDHRSLVPDVEQEVRLALWKRLSAGGAIEHPTSYLYKVALTTGLRVLRRLRPEEVAVEDPETLDEPAPASDPEGERRDRRLVLEQLLDRLDADQARALRAYLAGLNHREVAALFGWSEPVARHRIYRGIASLEKLGKEVAR